MSTRPPEVAVIDAHGKHAQAVHFTKDGEYLVSGGQDARVRVWSTEKFAAVRAFEGHKNSVNSLSFTGDEEVLATASSDGSVRIWSFPDGRCTHTIEKQMTGVFSPDGTRLATASLKGQVVVWDTKTWKPLAEVAPLERRVLAMAFGPERESLLVGGMGPIHRVSVKKGEKVGELKGHKSIVVCLRASADGEWLASAAADGYLRIWSTSDWREKVAIKIEGSGVFQLAFLPDGRAVAVSSDHLIQVYAVKDGKPVARIECPVKGLYGVAVSPSGRLLANAAADGKVRVWRLPAVSGTV